MSINYYGLPVRDAKRIGPIVEGTDNDTLVDEKKIRDTLGSLRSLKSVSARQLKWESGNDYILLDLMPNHVLVTHNAGRSSGQIEVLIDIMDALKRSGLFVYDPQQGNWFGE